jgi:hypothetical protein
VRGKDKMFIWMFFFNFIMNVGVSSVFIYCISPSKTWQNVGLNFALSTSKIGKTKKLLVERNKESDRRGNRSSSFIDIKTRISVQLQLQLNSFRTWVVSLEVWILQVMVLEIITWETSTTFQLSFATQDRIFDMHVQLDIWRCRTLRIHVRLRIQHRNTANSEF